MDQPYVVVLFGATGDLARRKLLPGLLRLFEARLLPDCRVIGTSLEELPARSSTRCARAACEEFGKGDITDERWRHFSKRLRYMPTSEGPDALAAMVKECEAELGEPADVAPAALPERAAEGRPRRDPRARRGRPGRPRQDHHGEAVRHRPRVGQDAQRRGAPGLRRGPDLPHRPLPRQGGGAEHPRLPLRQRPLRADLEPQLHRPRADRRARDPRPRGPHRVLRVAPAPTATWSSPT